LGPPLSEGEGRKERRKERNKRETRESQGETRETRRRDRGGRIPGNLKIAIAEKN
jgi:hypothetical protein